MPDAPGARRPKCRDASKGRSMPRLYGKNTQRKRVARDHNPPGERPPGDAAGFTRRTPPDDIAGRIQRRLGSVATVCNWCAAGAVTIMMALTVSDVVLRLFRHPIPGAYEIVGFLGAVFASFSLAYTSLKKGHIAVEFLVEKLHDKAQRLIDFVTTLICALLFAVVSWQSVVYAGSLKSTGEVSLTVQIPLYPFVYGIAVGTGLLALVLFGRSAVTGSRTYTTDGAGVPREEG